MASTSTSTIALFKPTAGTSEPFRTSDLNGNSDKVDAAFAADRVRLTAIEASNWVTAARIASGALGNDEVASGINGDKITSGNVYSSTRWAGRKVFVSSSFPDAGSGRASGDVLFKTS
jgi:hypothetical protein